MTPMDELRGVISAPQKTFAELRQRPTWLLSFLLVVLLTYVVHFIVFRVIVTENNFDQVARAKVL